MATFVHLAPEKERKRICRCGIKPLSGYWQELKGVYCMPVLRDFHVSHQWLRELKRSGQRTLVGIQFRIPDNEEVYVGHYNRAPLHVKAAEAIDLIARLENALGYEIFIPRKIIPKEIMRVRVLPQKIGWRYYPEAKGRAPCGCPVCIRRGEAYGRRIRRQWEEKMNG